MKRLLFGFSVLLISIGFSGCGSDEDTFKDGIMNFNKSLTVGEALDNWSNCESSQWESFETSNGIKIVQFTCTEKNPTSVNNELVSNITPVNFEMINTVIMKSIGDFKGSDWVEKESKKNLTRINQKISNLKNSNSLNIESVKDIFQFTINKDDSFKISSMQYEILWQDGKKFSAPQNMMGQLQVAYQDKVDSSLFLKDSDKSKFTNSHNLENPGYIPLTKIEQFYNNAK
jgi:hypothetical protein